MSQTKTITALTFALVMSSSFSANAFRGNKPLRGTESRDQQAQKKIKHAHCAKIRSKNSSKLKLRNRKNKKRYKFCLIRVPKKLWPIEPYITQDKGVTAMPGKDTRPVDWIHLDPARHNKKAKLPGVTAAFPEFAQPLEEVSLP